MKYLYALGQVHIQSSSLEEVLRIIQRYFSYFSMKTSVVSTHKNHLDKTALMMVTKYVIKKYG